MTYISNINQIQKQNKCPIRLMRRAIYKHFYFICNFPFMCTLYTIHFTHRTVAPFMSPLTTTDVCLGGLFIFFNPSLDDVHQRKCHKYYIYTVLVAFFCAVHPCLFFGLHWNGKSEGKKPPTRKTTAISHHKKINKTNQVARKYSK